jgi:hypothetical protein
MKDAKVRFGVLFFVVSAAIAGSVAMTAPVSTIRFCCTPQQSAACAAQGGTASCRTNVCQCLH